MNSIDLLREQLKSAHDTQEATISGVDEKSADFKDTNKAIPVGAAYAHSVLAEDMVLSMMLANKPFLFTSAEEAGVSEPMPSTMEWEKHEQWYKTVKVDLAKMHEFAQKVYEASDSYLASLNEKDLEKQMDLSAMGLGSKSLAFVISNFLILHIANLTGEISAAKGFQGLKGYPF